MNLIACPDPFGHGLMRVAVPAGETLAQLLVRVQPDPILAARAHVFIDDMIIPRENWARVRPKPGTSVIARVAPTGGGGGGKNPLRTVLMIAVAAAAFWAASALGPYVGMQLFQNGVGATWASALSIGKAIVGGAVGLAGNLLINAVAPPPVPKLADLSGSFSGGSPALSIAGTRNASRPYAPIASVLGKVRRFPENGARQYTEIVGQDQYVRALFVVGFGPLALSDHRIGETPIGDFEDVEIEIREGYPADTPITLFTDDVYEDVLSVHLADEVAWSQRRTQPDCDEISVDVFFPSGLFLVQGNGSRTAVTVDIVVEYSPAGADSWTGAGTISTTSAKAQPWRNGLRWTVTRGQYDVRLRRTSPELSVQEVSDVAHWTALRSITTRDPVVPTGLAEVAVRIKATDQLNGILDQYNCVAQTVAKAWNGAAWVEQATSQPGALFRHVLQGNALSAEYRPADAKIALTDLADWDDANIAAGREFNAVIDFATTVEDTLRDICAAGRAALSPNRDGQYSVVRDVEQTVPIQHFSPRNSWGFVGRKAFPDTPHALKVRFPNRDKDWTADERTVYDDGYDSTNATKFEVLELFGITDPVQVWRDGRYHIATARLRPETYELNVDVEHLVATRGDLVKVSHDVALFGIGSARVKSVTLDGSSNATAVTIDDAMPMEAGKSYSARFRKSDGASVLAAVDTVDGDNTVLTFATPIAAASPQPVAGDLMLFGETGSESVDLIVKEIQHAGDLAARLVLVDHAPAVHDADQGDIPAFDSQITVPPEINAPAPAKPKILDVLSGEDVLERDMAGTLQSRIVMVLDQRSSGAVPAVHLEPQFRRSATGAPWEKLPVLPPAATEASFAPVEDGAGYDVRIRAVGRYGATSAWAVRENHTVIGKTTPPPDVDAVYIEQMDDGAGRARFPYADPPVDFAGFRVKANVGLRDAWETGWLLHGEKELVKDPFFDLTMLNGLGQRVVMVKAVDVAGNESTNAARALLNAGDIPAGTIVDTIDHAALGWPGALTGGAVDGGAVKADDDGGLFWSGADAEPFWTGDTTQTFWATTYVQMVYLATVTPGHNDPRYRLGINATVAAPSWKAEYRRPLSASPFWYGDDARMFWQDDGDAFWTGLGEDGPFVPWPGSIKAGAEPIDIRVTTAPGTPRGVVSALSFTLGLDS